jgi:hypothetical protein
MATSMKPKTGTVDDTLSRVGQLLSSSFKKLGKEANAIPDRLRKRAEEFKKAEQRVEGKLRSGIRKTKGDVI